MASAQSFTLGQHATIKIMRHNHSIIACSRHIYGCYSSHTSCLWRIAHSKQHQWRGCNNMPLFLQWTALITRSFCEGSTWHNLHILVTGPFCCDWKARVASAQSFILWQQATIESYTAITLLLLVCTTYIWVLFFAHIPFVDAREDYRTFNQTWDDYTTNVIDYDYLQPAR